MMRDTRLCLLSPAEGVPVGDRKCFASFSHGVEQHRRLSAGAYALRQAFTHTSAAANSLSAGDTRDHYSWQILAVTDEEVVGAMRLRVYRPQNGVPSCDELFDYFGASIADEEIRRTVYGAAYAYAQSQFDSYGGFYLAGGLAVASSKQRSGFATVLTLAGQALLGPLGLHGGCTMSSADTITLSRYGRLGAFPLCIDGISVPTFSDAKHREDGRVLTFEPDRYEPHLAQTMAGLRQWIRQTTVIVGGAESEIAC
jgi:hypothetical protein